MIARYLDRPGSYPIDLSLSTVTQTKRFSFLDVDRLYDLLLPYLPRCRMISVTGDRGTDPTVLGLLNMFSQRALPILEHWKVLPIKYHSPTW
jgi:hypothetical protein